MKRREFIGLSAYTMTSISLFSIGTGCADKKINKLIAEPGLLSHITDKKNILEIGEGYLQQFPNEKNESVLENLLMENGSLPKSEDAGSIHSYFDSRSRKDFENGNTIIVGGWILARTEARQCALLQLMEK